MEQVESILIFYTITIILEIKNIKKMCGYQSFYIVYILLYQINTIKCLEVY